MPKDRTLRRIDIPAPANAGFATVETTPDLAPPALPTIPLPESLSLTTALGRSAVTPMALIAATWDAPAMVRPLRYAVQWSTNSSFPDGTTGGVDAVGESVTIDGLKPGTIYYVQVAAVYSGVQSAWCVAESITTATDTTPPDPISDYDDDFSTGDLIITWTNPPSDNFKDVQVDIYNIFGGTLRKTLYSSTGRVVWSAADNLATGGVGSDTERALVYVRLRARSYNNVYSTQETATIAKALPTDPAGVSITGILSTLRVQVTGTRPQDVVHYVYRIVYNGTTLTSTTSPSADQIFNASDSGNYQVGVTAYDIFGQASGEVLSSISSLDFLTIAKLRALATYTDSAGTSDLTSLKDGLVATGGVAYGASASWRWVLVERPLTDRYQNLTIVATAGIGYIGLSSDNTTWTWYSGTLGVDGRTLTSVANESAAQTAAINLPTSSSGRFDLPLLAEARFIKLGFKMTAGGTLREFYPRRLIEADDIRAQTLAAITADLGSITAGSLNAVDITGSTITGSTVQTAASGARVVMSAATNGGLIGYGSSDTYSPSAGTGTYQVRWSKTDGKLYAGSGAVVLDSNGFSINASAGYSDTIGVKFTDGATNFAKIQAIYTPTNQEMFISNVPTGSKGNQIVINSNVLAAGINSYLYLNSRVDNVLGSQIVLKANASGSNRIDLNYATVFVDQGLNIGTATGAGTGEINTSGAIDVSLSDAATSTPTSLLALRHVTTGTPAAGFGSDITINLESTTAERTAGLIRTTWITATDASRASRMRFFVFDTAARTALDLEASGTAPKVGFMGAAAVARQIVTGTRTGTLAQLQTVVANMLTALANLGLITDSTT